VRGEFRIAREPAFGVDVRHKERQVLVELEIVAGDGDDRRGERLVEIAGHQRRRQPLLGRLRAQEDDPQRRLVGAGRAHFGEVDGAAQQLFRNRLVDESIMRARLVKKQRKRIRGQLLGFGDVDGHGQDSFEAKRLSRTWGLRSIAAIGKIVLGPIIRSDQ
jgi:hypothetical protein